MNQIKCSQIRDFWDLNVTFLTSQVFKSNNPMLLLFLNKSVRMHVTAVWRSLFSSRSSPCDLRPVDHCNQLAAEVFVGDLFNSLRFNGAFSRYVVKLQVAV